MRRLPEPLPTRDRPVRAALAACLSTRSPGVTGLSMTRFEVPPEGGFRCDLVPNRSASWRHTRLFLGAVAGVGLAIAMGFTALGAWPVAPFAGLEVLAVTAGLYAAARASYRCEHIRTQGDALLVGRGIGAPGRWERFPRAFARVRYAPARGHCRGRLHLGAGGRYVEVGAFLNEAERQELAGQLARSLREGAAY